MPCGELVAIRLPLQQTVPIRNSSAVGSPCARWMSNSNTRKYLWEFEAALRVNRVTLNENRLRPTFAVLDGGDNTE